jgi:aminoglycoside/choline kinase family phosphotransferase
MPTTDRAVLLERFLRRCGLPGARPVPLAGDASFRRYFRLTDPRAVIMDAPPGLEDIRPFIAIAAYLKSKGYSSPSILGVDHENGYLLLEDLGDETFTRLITSGRGPSEVALYEAAVDLLADLHKHSCPAKLPVEGADPYRVPPYDAELLLREATLFTDWYYPVAIGEPCPAGVRKEFVDLWLSLFPLCEAKRPVLVLRDYHADNLMWLQERDGPARVGLLDFQDGVIGHAAYDLVSLLEDARRDVPPLLAEAMITRYIQAAKADEGDFFDAYAVLGAQRNTKIIGIFTRLWKRDGKPNYLKMIPRVWGLLERDLEHARLSDLAAWFDEYTPKPMRSAVLEAIE